MNIIILSGRVGQDPELKYGQDAKAWCRLSLAVNRGKKTNGDELPPDWFDCMFSDKQAEIIAEYVVKGQQLLVEGRGHFKEYDDKTTGAKVKGFTVHCHRFEFGQKPGDKSAQPMPQSAAPQPVSETTHSDTSTPESDLPF